MQHAVSNYFAFPLGTNDFLNGAAVSDFLPFRTLSSLYFLQDLPHVVVRQLLPHQGATVPTIRNSNSDDSQSQAPCLSFDILAVGTFLRKWSSKECVRSGVLPPLAMFGCKVVFLDTLTQLAARSSRFLKISR